MRTVRRSVFWTTSLFCAFGLAIVVAWHSKRVDGPDIHGRCTRLWLNDLNSQDLEIRGRAEEAIKAVDTNGLNFLLRELSVESYFVTRMILYVGKDALGIPLKTRSGSDRRALALKAFFVLKEKAMPILPQLAEFARNGSANYDIYAALLAFGKPGQQALIQNLLNQNSRVRNFSVIALGYVDPPDEDVKKAILHAMDDLDPQVSSQAEASYRRIQSRGFSQPEQEK